MYTASTSPSSCLSRTAPLHALACVQGGGSSGRWYRHDDSAVEAVSDELVLRQAATQGYLLFYINTAFAARGAAGAGGRCSSVGAGGGAAAAGGTAELAVATPA